MILNTSDGPSCQGNVCVGKRAMVDRKLTFLDREVEKISEKVDELVDDQRLQEDDARDIRDCVINIEIQLADLKEVLCGPKIEKQR